MRYKVRVAAEEFDCPTCGAPSVVGDGAWQDGVDGPCYCSAYCAGADPAMNQRHSCPQGWESVDGGVVPTVANGLCRVCAELPALADGEGLEDGLCALCSGILADAECGDVVIGDVAE